METEYANHSENHFYAMTEPMPLHEIPLSRRLPEAMKTIENECKRVHDNIDLMWGHRECDQYLSNLILNGLDGRERARIGFKRETAAALLVLSELHTLKFEAAT